MTFLKIAYRATAKNYQGIGSFSKSWQVYKAKKLPENSL